ncbi:MAG: pyridoxamine 5'-phosphate oxidase family protein [Acidimicrobiia bacterium]|nr:pyridoxamine 5'-phosphate oxidase family protein [Acidimicrobiia bacterium]
MAAYGVPTDLDGALPWEWAEERLVASRNYWVVTASARARPHAMPVWGVWLPDAERFWFSSSPDSRKARNLAENPRCSFAVDDTVECVSVEGLARRADPEADAAAVDAAAGAWARKYWDDPEVHAEMAGFFRGNAVFEVTPEQAFGIIEREDDFARRATRWRW